MTTQTILPTCRDCGVREGELHEPGCDTERCPFCGTQLICCPCWNEKLGLDKDAVLSDDQEDRFSEMLDAKGRVPYIRYPCLCRRCGAVNPKFFKVTYEEWAKYVQIDERESVLCLPCYAAIKNLIDLGVVRKRKSQRDGDEESAPPSKKSKE